MPGMQRVASSSVNGTRVFICTNEEDCLRGHVEGAGQCSSDIDLGRTAGVGSHASCVAEFEGTDV